MLKNYLLVAFRAVRRHPLYAAMNIVGLAAGLAAFVLIAFYIADELSFDRMHSRSDRIHRVVEARTSPDASERHFVYTSGALGPALADALPEVTASVRGISRWSAGRRVVARGDARFYVGDHLFTEPAFFETFDFPFVAGDPAHALDEPFDVVLTEAAAERYFGTENPIGEHVQMEGMGDLTVRGVVRLPENTHVGYSMFISFASLTQNENWNGWIESWESNGVLTYLLLAPDADAAAVEAKMQDFVRDRADHESFESRAPYLQALTDIHLRSGHVTYDENRAPGRMVYLILFGAVAVCVVLIAAMNYMNMATARSMRRAREVGMRKVVGAGRRQLAGQFLAESTLTSMIALLLGLGIVASVLPYFNRMADKSITLEIAANWPFFLGILAAAVSIGLIAGAYPAFYLSRFQPSDVLRGGTSARRSPVWKGIVVAQFAISITLIVATLVISRQLDFIQNKPLGFEEDQLVVVDINDGNVRSQFDVVKQEFGRVRGVESVSVSNNIPGDWKNIPQVEASVPGMDEPATVHFLGVDEAFLDTYRIRLIDGESFSGRFAADSTSLLVNQTAAKSLGVRPGDLVRMPDDEFAARVIGIVEDFHFSSLHEQIGPMLLGYRSNPIDVIDYFTIRFDAADIAQTIAGLRTVGERFDPEHPFEYNFLDERLADYYASERRVRGIFSAAAALAILIACLGLFGLAAYAAERRTKEIGIRKVLGATAAGLVRLMTTDFARLVAVAFILAAPLSYLAMHLWLQDFAYRTSVGWATLLGAGGIALLLAVLTVGYHALRAATADPVESLRYE